MDEEKRNVKGGKGYKKRKTNRERNYTKKENTLDVENGDGFYATVKRILGGNKVEVTLNNGTIGTVSIPGRMKKGRRGGWIRQDAYILVNKDNEIEKIIRNNDKDAALAHSMMDRAAGNRSGFNFYENDSSDDDEDNGEGERIHLKTNAAKSQPDEQTNKPERQSDSSAEDTDDEESESSSDTDSDGEYHNKQNNGRFDRRRQNTRGGEIDIDAI